MKTDTIFYLIFQQYPEIFFELLDRPVGEASSYQFTSVEVKQLAFRIDGLFLPTTGELSLPFYLVEVQFQSDEELYYRIFAELFLYLHQYRPPHPWRVALIYPTRNVEPQDRSPFDCLLSSSRVTRIYLDEIQGEPTLGVGVVKLIIESEAIAPEAAKQLVAQTEREVADPNRQRELIELIETIIVYKLPQKSREEIAAMLGLGDLKETRFYQDAFADGEQVGEQRGIEQGLQQGLQQANRQAVRGMLQVGLSLETIAQALNLPLELVRQWAEENREN
ncbi:Rpn family recombination-promoting nuclease/putative transposase [Oxynema sp. CENA135]|uniref:Rpn family recombination-promoting nuclease/putative transposase n=1 Tax=Oxynema sp. CENA135 TaxID=984206 RepID=UPI00190B89E5|nr:Rpn family recombination-promoting nuclease/putative transposase [Oxynema sp. CENA135]MBK4728965.1 Rpn family recombination-promoting nuclease/putative transposase [Oxynema sp. CENA135]